MDLWEWVSGELGRLKSPAVTCRATLPRKMASSVSFESDTVRQKRFSANQINTLWDVFDICEFLKDEALL